MVIGEVAEPSVAGKSNLKTYAAIVFLSAIYAADIFQKASRKYFWFDELFTVYLCRLPNCRSIWTAVLRGADFNPPLLHLLTRGAQALFGEGLIATRLPAIVGVWVFCICIFFFVARRAGQISGLVAGIFPLFTLVQYYAYEARSHGIVLGWCGLTLLCWQRYAERRSTGLWLTGFGLSLLGALLTHVYAVYILFPFFLVEVYNLFHEGRPEWGITAVAASSLATVTFAVYIPMFRMYRAMVPSTFFAASHDQVERFLVAALGPAIGVLLIALALFAFETKALVSRAPLFAAIPMREILIAVGLTCIPFVGLLGSKISHGPFIERYFLSSIAGYAILLGFATARGLSNSWPKRILAICMILLLVGDLGSTTYLGIRNRVVLLEPSSGVRLNTDVTNPMARYETVSRSKNDLDILVLSGLDYFYLFHYAPAQVVSRLYYEAPERDVVRALLEKLAKGAHLAPKTTTVAEFCATRDRFFVYESGSSAHADEVESILKAGFALKSAAADSEGAIYEYDR